MKWWKFCSVLFLALALGIVGCGSSASNITITVTPATVSVITNQTQQFSPNVTGTTNAAVTWTVTCPTNVVACGTIDTNGLYTAPATIPTVLTNGTATITPTATITVTSQADTSKTATATVTIVSGISITITPTTATVGTNETFPFTVSVINPGCNQSVVGNQCLVVNWTLPTTITNPGSINSSGVYTAPGTVPSPSAITVTATSASDSSVTATAIVNVVTATTPTLTSVSPHAAALGSLFADIYLTGANFISTSNVFVNGVPVTATAPAGASTLTNSVLRARIPANILAVPPASGVLQVTVAEQNGAPQNCAPDITLCQIVVSTVRPAVTGPSPDSVLQNSTGGLSFNVDGGFYGIPTNPTVNTTYDGQIRGAAINSTNIARQVSIGIGNPGDLGTAGLHQVGVYNSSDPTKYAATNLAVQPNVSGISLLATLPVGTTPSDVAINPATGMAVVANTGSNNITLIDLTLASPPATIAMPTCSGVPPCGPKSVAVDYVRNIALVANSGAGTTCPQPTASSCSIAVVDLNTQTVTAVIPTPAPGDQPAALGINPVTGRALVTMNSRDYALLMDLTVSPPVFVGPVSISTGTNTRVAVEPHLNWAIATPGGAGSIGIVDLNSQTTNNIVSISRTTNVVTVTVQAASQPVPQSPLGVVPSDAVEIQGVSDNSFNGIYAVTSRGPGALQFTYTQTGASLPDVGTFNTGGTVNYSEAVATMDLTSTMQGIAINPETQQAVLTDPSPTNLTSGVVAFFSLLDQNVVPLTLQTSQNPPTTEAGATAAAFNPLTNVAITVNRLYNTLSVIDPVLPARLNNASPFQVGNTPVAVAVDPGTNIAVVANQGDNTVSIVSLGTIRSPSITETSPKTFTANSTLSSPPAPAAIILTVLGYGFAGSPSVRLDGVGLATTFVSSRQLTAIVPPNLLSSARRFAVDVLNPGNVITNASDFSVTQSIDVSAGTGCASAPLPSGVAIDPQQGIAAVSLSGCNTVALINMPSGTGQTVAVGTNPLGIAVLPRLHEAIVANNGSSNVSVVDELAGSVTNTITTGAGPMGVAVDQDTGEAATADNVGNDVTVLNVSTGSTASIPAGQGPVAVAFNYQNHQVAVANATSNSVQMADAAQATVSATYTVALPTSLLYDPWTGDCPTSNLVGCFLVVSSTGNLLETLDPTTSGQSSVRVGINPTAIAYNPLTATVISTNTGSHTVTVVDLLAGRVRAVLSLPPAPVNSTLALTGPLQFAVDIHPLTNLAVIADTANGRVLFVPVPR